jgi:hypothetical protein
LSGDVAVIYGKNNSSSCCLFAFSAEDGIQGLMHARQVLYHSSCAPVKTLDSGGHWWLRPVILATREAESRRITVQSHPRQIVQETLS